MMSYTLLRDDFNEPSVKLAFGMAVSFHIMMFAWNPTILSGGAAHLAPVLMQVEFREKLPPPIAKPAPIAKPEVHKIVEKHHPVKKAHKSGLTLTQAAHHAVRHHAPARTIVASRPRHVPLAIPKFVPHSRDDEPIAAAAHSSLAVPAHRVASANVFQNAPHLNSKTRGVKMSDIHFEMGNAGTLSEHVGGGPVVNIPVGEERGEIAALPSAPPMLHNAPGGRRGVSSFRYQPGEGGGELAGRAKAGHHMTSGHIDINGTGVGEEAVMAAAVDGHGKGIAGQGFEIGGPVGDRKVVRRRLPEYPAWAEEKGISAMVKIYFTVRPDGTIRSTMRILRSSGYAELDSLAKDALANWRFSPTSARSTTEEAWGVITFRFTLA